MAGPSPSERRPGADAQQGGARGDAGDETRPTGDHLVVGLITRAHGIKGEVYVRLDTDRPDVTFAPGAVMRLGDEGGTLPPDAPTLTVESTRPYKRGALVKFEEVPDRTIAERLVRRYLLAAEEDVAPLEEGEVFYHQLIGLEVVTTDGREVGRVREVFEAAPHDLLEVKGEGKVHLIPFADHVVERLELEDGRLVIEPPPGLLDL